MSCPHEEVGNTRSGWRLGGLGGVTRSDRVRWLRLLYVLDRQLTLTKIPLKRSLEA